jgi:hypothetical protein
MLEETSPDASSRIVTQTPAQWDAKSYWWRQRTARIAAKMRIDPRKICHTLGIR